MKQFKKLIYSISIAFIFSIFTIKVDAANLNVSMSSSTNKTVIGNTITYTVKVSSSTLLGSLNYRVTYDSNKLTLTSGTLSGVPVFTGSEKTATYTFKFKAKAKGNANVTFTLNEAIDWNDVPFTYNKSTSKNVTIISQSELEASYSKNNNLSNLKVDNYTISPAFNKNTTEYSLTVENDVKTINISGSKEDSKSSVTGLGTHQLSEGINKLQVKVTAQNGSTKTYTINVTVKELSPIIVEINGNKYNVVRKKELLEKPNSEYEDTTIKINEEEVPAFINNNTNVILVGLKDSEGNIKLYSYKDNTYILYKEISSNNIIVTESTLTNIPKGFKEVNIKINNTDVKAYQKIDDNTFNLIYATNIQNGITSLYKYDSKENTLQLFSEKEDTEKNNLEKKNKYYEYIIIGLGSVLAITYFSILITYIKKEKRRKKRISKEHIDDVEDKSNEEEKFEIDFKDSNKKKKKK